MTSAATETKIQEFIDSIRRNGNGDQQQQQQQKQILITRETAIKFLSARKYDIQRAITLYEQHELIRFREGLYNLNPSIDPLLTELQTGKFTILPERDAGGSAIALFTANLHYPLDVTHKTTLQGVVYQLDCALQNSQTQKSGLIFIYDMSASKYSNFDYDLSQKILTLLKGGYPARLKKVLIVTAPLWFKAPFKILRLFVREKLRERVFTVSIPQLTLHIPRDSLPVRLGGTLEINHPTWLIHCYKSMTNRENELLANIWQSTAAATTTTTTTSATTNQQILQSPHGELNFIDTTSSNEIIPASSTTTLTTTTTTSTTNTVSPLKRNHNNNNNNNNNIEKGSAVTSTTKSITQQPILTLATTTPLTTIECTQISSSYNLNNIHQTSLLLLNGNNHPHNIENNNTEDNNNNIKNNNNNNHNHNTEENPNNNNLNTDETNNNNNNNNHNNIINGHEEQQPSSFVVAVDQQQQNENQQQQNQLMNELWTENPPSSASSGFSDDDSLAVVSASFVPKTIEQIVQMVKERGRNGLIAEYAELRQLPVDGTYTNAISTTNLPKNRYTDVLCFDHSRVVLSQENDDPSSDYINANFVDGYKQRNAYISTQGPIHRTIADFWRMIWEQHCQMIVMTTKVTERGRAKCAQYWEPIKYNSCEYGNFHIRTTQSDTYENYTVVSLELTNLKTDETRNVSHWQFTSWPDYGVPSSATAMLTFLQRVREQQAIMVAELGDTWAGHVRGPPIVVHCSAGIGRTGTFITLDICISRLEDVGMADIKGTVETIRTQRSCSIQVPDQYVFCHLALIEYALSRGMILATDLNGIYGRDDEFE